MLRLIETCLLPPAGPLLLGLLGLLVVWKRKRLGIAMVVVAVLALIGSSLPWVGAWALTTLQTHAALDPAVAPKDAEAIVVLSAEMDVGAPEYGAQTVGPMTLQRIRYAATLQRRTGLPVLVSGGLLSGHRESHAASMQRALEQDFQVPVRWAEARSLDTRENARYSAEMLRADGVKRVLLVTHAWHMPRAHAAFTAAGIEAIAAPTAFAALPTEAASAWLPRWAGIRDTCLALHEWLGRAYYAMRS